MVCMVEVAAGGGHGVDKWACLSVCFVEFCSIVSNILKPKGYALNAKGLLAVLAGRFLNARKEDVDEIFEKTEDKKKEDKE